MRSAGLALGGSLQNAIVLDETRVLNTRGPALRQRVRQAQGARRDRRPVPAGPSADRAVHGVQVRPRAQQRAGARAARARRTRSRLVDVRRPMTTVPSGVPGLEPVGLGARRAGPTAMVLVRLLLFLALAADRRRRCCCSVIKRDRRYLRFIGHVVKFTRARAARDPAAGSPRSGCWRRSSRRSCSAGDRLAPTRHAVVMPRHRCSAAARAARPAGQRGLQRAVRQPVAPSSNSGVAMRCYPIDANGFLSCAPRSPRNLHANPYFSKVARLRAEAPRAGRARAGARVAATAPARAASSSTPSRASVTRTRSASGRGRCRRNDVRQRELLADGARVQAANCADRVSSTRASGCGGFGRRGASVRFRRVTKGGYRIEHHPGHRRQCPRAHDHARLAALGRRRRSLLLVALFVAFTLLFNFVTLKWAAAVQHPWLQAIVLADQREEAARIAGAGAGSPERDGDAAGRTAGADAAARRPGRAPRRRRRPEAAGTARRSQPGTRPGRGGAESSLPSRDFSVTRVRRPGRPLARQVDAALRPARRARGAAGRRIRPTASSCRR